MSRAPAILVSRGPDRHLGNSLLNGQTVPDVRIVYSGAAS